jgi:hypothetical protein
MQLEIERGRNTKIAAAAAQAPEQVLVLLRAGRQEFSIRRHQVDAAHVVTGQSEAPAQAAESATERESTHARVGHRARGGDQAMRQRLSIQRASKAPPSTVAIFFAGSTCTPFIGDRSIISPFSHTDWPERLCPPPRTASSSWWDAANFTACMTVCGTSAARDQCRMAVERHRSMRAAQSRSRAVAHQQLAAQAGREIAHVGGLEQHCLPSPVTASTSLAFAGSEAANNFPIGKRRPAMRPVNCAGSDGV